MTGWNLMINYTSVEGIQRGGIHNIAFLVSQPSRRSSTTLPPPESPPSPPSKSSKKKSGKVTQGGDAEEDWPILTTVTRPSKRSYVVMQTKPFEHPWYTSLMQGWKDTMGNGIIDWLLPLKQSPCKSRSYRGEFEWGEVVYDMARMYEEKHPETRLALLHGSSRR
jgi:palmitoyltransferase